jgi:hypothetical protein
LLVSRLRLKSLVLIYRYFVGSLTIVGFLTVSGYLFRRVFDNSGLFDSKCEFDGNIHRCDGEINAVVEGSEFKESNVLKILS